MALDGAIKSAKRAFEVLEAFERHRRPLGLKELVEELGYPASSGSALMKSLVEIGYLDYDRERRTYFPTMRIAAVGSWVPKALFGEGRLSDELDALQARTGHTVILAVQSDLHAQYVHVVHAPERLDVRVPPGTRRPLARSGLGLVLLSGKTDAEVERLRRRINAASDGEALSREEMLARVDAVRQRGYAFSKHGISQGVGVIGAALPRGPFGRVFAIGVAGSVTRLEADENEIVTELAAAVRRLMD